MMIYVKLNKLVKNYVIAYNTQLLSFSAFINILDAQFIFPIPNYSWKCG